jgi:micrococcal nuclease
MLYRRIVSAFLLVVLFVSLTAGTVFAEGVQAQVVRVIDGDTIAVQINGKEYKVRYILINAPEVGQYYADIASQANSDLVKGRTVTLVKDVSETDKYGRLLRYVYLRDGTFVNERLVRNGYAQMATFPPDVAHQELIAEAQREAQANHRGLWKNTDAPAQPAAQTPAATPAAKSAPAAQPVAQQDRSKCDPHYPDNCFPYYPPDLDCAQVAPAKDFKVVYFGNEYKGKDPHRFDKDHDGIGCESR